MVEIVDLGSGMRVIRGYRVWQLVLHRTIDGELARLFPGACFEPILYGVIYCGEAWSVDFAPARCFLCPEAYRERPIHGFGIVREDSLADRGRHPYGWHAFSSFRLAMDYLASLLGQNLARGDSAGWVIGTCLLAGQVVQAEAGYRATHAAIEALAGPEPGAIFLMKSPRVQGIEELYDMLRQPPIVEMDWPFEADIPVWAVPDFRQQFDLALRRVRGGLVDIARKAGISLPVEG